MAIVHVNGPCWIYVGIPARIPLSPAPPSPGQVSQQGQNIISSSIGPGNPTGPLPETLANPSALDAYMAFFRPVFFGSTERGVDFELNPKYRLFYRDEDGDTPCDKVYLGQEAWIPADLNRFNEPVYAIVASRTAGAQAAPVERGIDPDGAIGTMMLASKAAYPVWLVGSYAGKPINFINGAPNAYRFFCCTTTGPEKVGPLATRAKKVRPFWHALPLKVGKDRILYDHSIDGLGPID